MARAIILACLATLGLTLAPWGAAHADSALRSLETGDDGRAWLAVGRLDLDGRGFCTATLVAPDQVLTAAHCMFDKATGKRLDAGRIQFLAGWRNGRASAYRGIRRAAVHPDYDPRGKMQAARVRHDVALLELQHPIRNTQVVPFQTEPRPHEGQRIGVVSYARGREAAPSLQDACGVLSRQQGVLVMSCDVDFGASGSPVFSFDTGQPRIVSVVSAMAKTKGRKVSLGTELLQPLADLRAQLASNDANVQGATPRITRLGESGTRRDIGAKFAKP